MDRLSRGYQVEIISEAEYKARYNSSLPDPIPASASFQDFYRGLNKSTAKILVYNSIIFYTKIPYELWETETFAHLWPSKPIQEEVDKYLRTHLPSNYTAVHFRKLEGDCLKKVPLVCQRFKQGESCINSLIELCHMEPDFLERVRRMYKKQFQTLYLATDGQTPNTDKLIHEAGGLTYPFAKNTLPIMSMAIDYWIMVLSDLFIRNPISTISLNVMRKRASLPPSHARGPSYMGAPYTNYPEDEY